MDGLDLGAAFVTAVVVWLAALITPGPDFAATVHAAASGTRRDGLGVAGGVTAGMLAWAVASLFGLQALLHAFEGLGTLLRVAGAAYLGYIGVRLLWAAWQGVSAGVEGSAGRIRPMPSAFRHGLLTNLANPKALALFGSMFAVLVPSDAPPWFTLSFLAAIVLSTATWYVLVAYTMSAAVVARAYRRAERGINAVTGALFVGVSARLATDR